MPNLCTACGAKLTAYQALAEQATLCSICESVDDAWPDPQDETVPNLAVMPFYKRFDSRPAASMESGE